MPSRKSHTQGAYIGTLELLYLRIMTNPIPVLSQPGSPQRLHFARTTDSRPRQRQTFPGHHRKTASGLKCPLNTTVLLTFKLDNLVLTLMAFPRPKGVAEASARGMHKDGFCHSQAAPTSSDLPHVDYMSLVSIALTMLMRDTRTSGLPIVDPGGQHRNSTYVLSVASSRTLFSEGVTTLQTTNLQACSPAAHQLSIS